MDRWTDTYRDVRAVTATGKTHFVGGSRNMSATPGTSANSFTNLAQAVSAANNGGGDIIMIRPGSFDNSIRITKPVTLRATKPGPATVGN